MDASFDPNRPWYESDPERLESELEAFRTADLATRVDYRDDRLILKTEVPFKGDQLPLEVVYPVNFPYGRPRVHALNERILGRHQTPDTGDLCVLASPDKEWHPSHTGASLVDRAQRTLLADTERGPEAVRDGEAEMPEPYSGYIPSGYNRAFVVPEPFRGDIEGVSGAATFRSNDHSAILVSVEGNGNADKALVEKFIGKDAAVVGGGWIALRDGAVVLQGTAALEAAMVEAAEKIKHLFPKTASGKALKNHSKKSIKRRTQLRVAITFMEEGGSRGETRRAWIECKMEMRPLGQLSVVEGSLERSQALSLSERTVRTPELAGAGRVQVIVIGAGSVGSPVIVELAKAGVGRIDVIDYDTVDVNNPVRHLAPFNTAGRPKADVVCEIARELNPFARVESHVFSITSSAANLAATRDLVEMAHLVIDTTGSAQVSRTLESLCRDVETDLLVAGLTAGALGGDIFLIQDDGPCFDCFLINREDNPVQCPPSGPESKVTPVGCNHPTFTGSGFDATEFAMNVTRLALQHLEAVQLAGPEWNLSVVRFREAPRVEFFIVEKQVECVMCDGVTK